jgi:capsular exopolysaccharide synthesis family protein
LCATVAVLWSWIYTTNATPQYRASAQLLFSSQPIDHFDDATDDKAVDALGELTQGLAFSRDKVETYAQLVTSTQVLGPVMESLALPGTEDELRARVVAVATADTATLLVTVQDSNPQRAARTAAAIAQRLPEVVSRLESEAAGGKSPVRAILLREAAVPSLPFWPRADFNLAVGLVTGLVVGIGLATMRDQLDTRIRGEQQLFEVALASPLASVPRLPRGAAQDAVLAGWEEAVTRLRVNLGVGAGPSSPRSLLVTSARPGDGKTDLAIALAQSCARGELRVLLVDCDLRSSALSVRAGMLHVAGVSEALIGLAPAAALVRSGSDGVQVVPAGRRPPNPAEVLGSRFMGELVAAWRNEYDLVVLDGTALVGIADALALVPHVDSVLCVVRDGVTRRSQLAEALALVTAVRGNLAGIVLNAVRRRPARLSRRPVWRTTRQGVGA